MGPDVYMHKKRRFMCFSGVTKQPLYKSDSLPVASAGVGYYYPSPETFVWANANMPTSTNMQSSTHLPLLVLVLVMAARMKPLPHPSSPPPQECYAKERKESKQHVGQSETFSKKEKTSLDQMTGFILDRKSGSLHRNGAFPSVASWLHYSNWEKLVRSTRLQE